MCQPPAPLFRDPIYDGAADPTIIYNRQEKSWWIIYTNRRANVEGPRLAWVHGTDIGVASSSDGGATWLYRGTLQGLEFENGRNTFWAPEVIFHDGLYHMYVSYLPGVPSEWTGTRNILHYTSADLWHWAYQSRLALSSDFVIDACVHPLPDGNWRLWYKDEAHGSHTYAADSPDLYHWTVKGPIITDCPHEGPNVFQWKGSYWMITDPWKGLGVYRSDDLESWTRQDNILAGAGKRADDGIQGGHADVLVTGVRAFVIYFTHPGRAGLGTGNSDTMPYDQRRTSIQAAELDLVDGRIACDRDREFEFKLPAELP